MTKQNNTKTPNVKISKKKKKRKKRNKTNDRIDGSWDGTVFLGFITGNAVEELRLVHMVHTNPVFAREDDPKVGSQSTPLSTVASIHQRYRLTKCVLRLVRMVTNTAYSGSNLYIWHNKTPGLMVAQSGLDALLATKPHICSIGDSVEKTYPSTGWMDVNTAATDVEQWEQYTLQVYITGKTMPTFYQSATPFAGNLWMAYVDLHYEFQEVRPTMLSILSSRDIVVAGSTANVVTLPNSSKTPGALCLQVTSSSKLGRMLGIGTSLTTGQVNAIWELGDATVSVVSSFLGSFGWILQGGWFVLRKHFAPDGAAENAGVESYLIYPSLVQAQQENFLTGTVGQDVATLTGTVSIQQLTNPNWAGSGSSTFAGGKQVVGYPIELPPTSDDPPLPLGGQVLFLRTSSNTVVSPTESTAMYTWTLSTGSDSSWTQVTGNTQLRGAFDADAAKRFAAIKTTEVVIGYWQPASTQMSILWKGSLDVYVNELITKKKYHVRTGPSSRYVYGFAMPFPICRDVNGFQMPFEQCWFFCGRALSGTTPELWEAVYFKPGPSEFSKWPTDTSKWTMKQGCNGSCVGFQPSIGYHPSHFLDSDSEDEFDLVAEQLVQGVQQVEICGHIYDFVVRSDGTIEKVSALD